MIENLKNINPLSNESPVEFANRVSNNYNSTLQQNHKKSYGQYFTPLEIANLMSSLSTINYQKIKILDPGCGTASLSCALVEFLLKQYTDIDSIELVAYEIDSDIIPFTHIVLNYLKKWASDKGVEIRYSLLNSDFVLDNVSSLSDSFFAIDKFDIIISNPPYFKLNKNDNRALSANMLISGQPNIYSIFLGIASRLLNKNGELIFITPRSFASGNYFKAFRKFFFSSVKIGHIHLFHSRKDAFSSEKVLQETIIIKASKSNIESNYKIKISSSNGISDISKIVTKTFWNHQLIDINSNEKLLHLPTNNSEIDILSLVSNWKNRLIDFKIQISTGKVVSFRALKYIQNNYENGNVFLAPLFWLHNVNKMSLQWPLNLQNKGQYIRIKSESLSLLIPNKNYIFLRRFSTKDDKSRLIAAPYFCNYTNTQYIGVENKVNYLYKIEEHLSRNETVGLCALLNSQLYNTYFQIINGNINVSATELREMKLPSINIIREIGNSIILSNDYSMENVNNTINKFFKLENIFVNHE